MSRPVRNDIERMAIPTSPVSLDLQFRRYFHDIGPILKKQKTRASTAAVFSFLAVSLFLWYAVRPTAQTIIYLRREIADKTVLDQQMEAKITSLIDAQSAYENIKDRLPVLDQALPPNPDAVTLARELRNIANITNASLSALQIPSVPLIGNESSPGAKLVAGKPLQEFVVTVVVSGPYESIKAFLNGILTLRRITRLESISIKPVTDLTAGASTTNLLMSIRLKTYYSLQ